MRVGEEGQGWRIAQTTLTNERAVQLIEITSSLRASFDRLVLAASDLETPNGASLVDDVAFHERLAEVGLSMEALEALSAQSLARVVAHFSDIGPNVVALEARVEQHAPRVHPGGDGGSRALCADRSWRAPRGWIPVG
jgi:alkylation response protein AidB-like acyl-CoA dehydrogenase